MAVKTYLPGRRQGIPANLLDAGVHPSGHRHPRLLQDHPQPGVDPRRSLPRCRGGRRSPTTGTWTTVMDGPADRPGLLRAAPIASRTCPATTPASTPSSPTRSTCSKKARWSTFHLAGGGDDVRLQRHPRALRLKTMRRSPMSRPAAARRPGIRSRARQAPFGWPPAAGLHHQKPARSVGQELPRPRGVRVPAAAGLDSTKDGRTSTRRSRSCAGASASSSFKKRP